MSMNESHFFRTQVVSNGKALQPLSPHHRVLLLGSCFSDEMKPHFEQSGVRVMSNPFGALYNPVSIAKTIQRLLDGPEFTELDLFCHEHLYHSFTHHGSFSDMDPDIVVERLNRSLKEGREALLNADVIILTLGSATVWEHDGQVIANCHRLPPYMLSYRQLAIEEMVHALDEVLRREELREKRIIFTVSPIRHKDNNGLMGNSLSKAKLRVAVDELVRQESHPRRVYFPSYEIFMDELRDYRWYAEDMMHPTEAAVSYVWAKFVDYFYSLDDGRLMENIASVKNALRHRPIHGETPEYLDFRRKTEERWKALCVAHPWLND